MNPLSVQKLSDSQLVSELKDSVSDERKRTAIILEFLREVDRRKLYADYGCASLWEFCVKELGYSKGSASRRVNSMRLLRDIPDLKEDIILGKFNLTTLSQAQNFFNLEEKHSGEKLSSENKSEVLSKLEGKSETECELELIRMSSMPMEISNPEKERIINDEYTEWKILIDAELQEMLDRIRALRSHAQPAMSKAENRNIQFRTGRYSESIQESADSSKNQTLDLERGKRSLPVRRSADRKNMWFTIFSGD